MSLLTSAAQTSRRGFRDASHALRGPCRRSNDGPRCSSRIRGEGEDRGALQPAQPGERRRRAHQRDFEGRTAPYAACEAQRHGRDERLLRAGRRPRRPRRPPAARQERDHGHPRHQLDGARATRSSPTTRSPGRSSPGPHQEFFVCNTIQAGLGEPLVDNQDGKGFRVQNPDGSTAGWSLDCSANTKRRLPVPHHQQHVQADAERRLASVRHGADDAHSTVAPSTTSCAVSAARSTASSTRSRCSRRSATTRAPSSRTPRSGTSARSSRSTAACRSATARARPAASALYDTGLARATRSCTPRATARARTTTCCSAARRR